MNLIELLLMAQEEIQPPSVQDAAMSGLMLLVGALTISGFIAATHLLRRRS